MQQTLAIVTGTLLVLTTPASADPNCDALSARHSGLLKSFVDRFNQEPPPTAAEASRAMDILFAARDARFDCEDKREGRKWTFGPGSDPAPKVTVIPTPRPNPNQASAR